MEYYIQVATIISPIISVIAIIVALYIAKKSSKEAQLQITAIHDLLDVFIATNNLDIVEAQREYIRQLSNLDKQIESVQEDLDTIRFISNGVSLDSITAYQEKTDLRTHLGELLKKRENIVLNLDLIDNYIRKATKGRDNTLTL